MISRSVGLPMMQWTQDFQAKPSTTVVAHVDNGAKDGSRHRKYLVLFGEAVILQSSAESPFFFSMTSYLMESDKSGSTISSRNRVYVSKKLYKAIREYKRGTEKRKQGIK